MKPLKLLMLEATNKGWKDLKMEPRKGYFNDAYRVVAPKVRELIAAMANTHSLEQVEMVKADLSDQVLRTELHEMSDKELLKMCGQIRTLWRDLFGNAGRDYRRTTHRILEEWWKHYELSDSKRWLISYETRSFFPTQMNYRALMATILFENRTHMKTCSNCSRYFFGPRRSSKYCMQADCQLAYNNERQQKHIAKKNRAN